MVFCAFSRCDDEKNTFCIPFAYDRFHAAGCRLRLRSVPRGRRNRFHERDLKRSCCLLGPNGPSSSMFNITSCQLTAEGGELTAVMEMGGKGYLRVFLGTAEEAAAAPVEDGIPYSETASGTHTFTLPVEALDLGIPCAAFSKNKEMWYDRTLVFRADSLPLEAFAGGTLTAADTLEDGNYTVSIQLEGGSGRASVESPAALRVENGMAYAAVMWSSSNYDYMRIGEEKYFPVSAEGNSTFEIPVNAFDWKLTVYANTTAMSTPHEIEYTLYFDSSTIEKAE